MAKILSVDNLLKMPLVIPNYQRPYKWTTQNIDALLNDISDATNDYQKYNFKFKYRVGTIILHDKSNGLSYDIVDGQQRIISLSLIRKCIDSNFSCDIFNISFANKSSQINIHNNFEYIKEWFSLKEKKVKDNFINAFRNILEVVVLSVTKVSEAFQLFDSQNTRGKALDPHDLLKAFHLREMKKYPYEMEAAVTKWEAKDTKKIGELFANYLFPIWNWSRGRKTTTFTTKEIDIYKGVPEFSDYTYAKRVNKATPYFQITEPFVAGNDFFEMVDHYLQLLSNIQTEICVNKDFKEIYKIITITKNPDADDKEKEFIQVKKDSIGFRHTRNLFFCALLCYYDRFHNFDTMAVKKLCRWAFALRLDMVSLGFDSINKYAIGDMNNARYTNNIPMFSQICYARKHTEISGLQIKINDVPNDEKWEPLYNILKTL